MEGVHEKLHSMAEQGVRMQVIRNSLVVILLGISSRALADAGEDGLTWLLLLQMLLLPVTTIMMRRRLRGVVLCGWLLVSATLGVAEIISGVTPATPFAVVYFVALYAIAWWVKVHEMSRAGNDPPAPHPPSTPDSTPASTSHMHLQPNRAVLVSLWVLLLPALGMVWVGCACTIGVESGWVSCGTHGQLVNGTILAATGVALISQWVRAVLQVTTRMTDAGIAQRSLRGRIFIPWTEVRRVDSRESALVFRGDGRRITIWVGFFPNLRDLEPVLRTRLSDEVFSGLT
jgi:hypothetical protein